MKNVFIARQPVYNKQLEAVAFELLFRNEKGDSTGISDAGLATSQVVLNLLLDIGLDQIAGDKPVFLNISRDFLFSDLVHSLDKKRVYLELCENIEPDKDVIEMLSKLSIMDYRINLDNFVYHFSKDRLVELADYIKIDASALTRDELKYQVNQLRQSTQARIIVSKIETKPDFDFCMDLPVDYLQGYYLSQPNIIRGNRLAANRYSVLELQKKLHQEGVVRDEIIELIAKDFSLTYRVLSYVREKLQSDEMMPSISRAVELVGLEEIRTWIDLLAMSKLDDRPNDLLVSALTRGKMCQLMAQALNREDADAYYIVGLFSHVDAMLERNLSDLLDSLPLSNQINQALLYRKGAMGDALNCVIAYERGDWDAVSFENAEKSLIVDCYLRAIEWASDLGSELIAC